MEFLLDTVRAEQIRDYQEIYRIDGVTCNPSILARECDDFFGTLSEIKALIGDRQLHIQVTGEDVGVMLEEASAVTDAFGMDTFLKVPANEEGILAIREMKKHGYRVTATAIFTVQQAVLAGAAGADYVAPYYNRMCVNGVDAEEAIRQMRQIFNAAGFGTKILAASFKNVQQITRAIVAGADAITAQPMLYTEMVETAAIHQAVDGFLSDWKNKFGERNIHELAGAPVRGR